MTTIIKSKSVIRKVFQLIGSIINNLMDYMNDDEWDVGLSESKRPFLLMLQI